MVFSVLLSLGISNCHQLSPSARPLPATRNQEIGTNESFTENQHQQNTILVGGFNHLEKTKANVKHYPIYYGKNKTTNQYPINCCVPPILEPPNLSLLASNLM